MNDDRLRSLNEHGLILSAFLGHPGARRLLAQDARYAPSPPAAPLQRPVYADQAQRHALARWRHDPLWVAAQVDSADPVRWTGLLTELAPDHEQLHGRAALAASRLAVFPTAEERTLAAKTLPMVERVIVRDAEDEDLRDLDERKLEALYEQAAAIGGRHLLVCLIEAAPGPPWHPFPGSPPGTPLVGVVASLAELGLGTEARSAIQAELLPWLLPWEQAS